MTRLGREAALRDVAERRTRDRRSCGNLIDIRGSTINPLKRKEFGILSPIFFNSAFVRDKHTTDTWYKSLLDIHLISQAIDFNFAPVRFAGPGWF